MQSGIQTRPAALVRDRPYVFQPLTFLSPPLNTEHPVRDSLLKSWRGRFCSACASQLGLPGPQWRCSTAQKNLVSRSVWAIRPTGSGDMLRRVPCG